MSKSLAEAGALTLPFDKFWAWLQAHHNCILRAGTPDVLLFDHEDYHWHLAQEDERTLVIQLCRGKDLVGELILMIEDVAYVQVQNTEAEECVFEVFVETVGSRDVAYQFVMSHGYDGGEVSSARRWAH